MAEDDDLTDFDRDVQTINAAVEEALDDLELSTAAASVSAKKFGGKAFVTTKIQEIEESEDADESRWSWTPQKGGNAP